MAQELDGLSGVGYFEGAAGLKGFADAGSQDLEEGQFVGMAGGVGNFLEGNAGWGWGEAEDVGNFRVANGMEHGADG